MPDSTRGKRRRRAAKATIDFATGEIHDRLIDAAESLEGVALEQLSADERRSAQFGATRREKGRRAAAKSGRSWVKARKIP